MCECVHAASFVLDNTIASEVGLGVFLVVRWREGLVCGGRHGVVMGVCGRWAQ